MKLLDTFRVIEADPKLHGVSRCVNGNADALRELQTLVLTLRQRIEALEQERDGRKGS